MVYILNILKYIILSLIWIFIHLIFHISFFLIYIKKPKKKYLYEFKIVQTKEKLKNKNTKVITEYHYDTPFHYLFNCKNYSNKNSYYIVSHVTVFPSACWDDDDGYSI